MACQEAVLIGQTLGFNIATHDTTYGELTDADSVPTYKVYDENNGFVTSGTMAKIDSNEDGFYFEELLCEEEDFEDGSKYKLCIKAMVEGNTGGITYQFTAHTEIGEPIGHPIIIQGFDAMAGKQVHISGRYK